MATDMLGERPIFCGCAIARCLPKRARYEPQLAPFPFRLAASAPSDPTGALPQRRVDDFCSATHFLAALIAASDPPSPNLMAL